MDDISLIIQTKLNRPHAPGDLVPRPELIERLDRGRQRPLTLVTAPAGYGKSTLLGHWLDTMPGQPSAWLSLDKNDDNLVSFLTYFVAAIQTMFPRIGQETAALLSLTEDTPQRVLLATLINELNTIEEAFILVIDDYHTIHTADTQRFMVEMVTYVPDRMHLALASRRDPHLPLVQFRAKDQVTEIRAHDLRFTMAEANAFLRRNWGEAFNKAAAKNIYERSEGWATGLRLAVLSLGRFGDLDSLEELLQASDRFVVDYLMTETLSNQRDAIQEWLLKTAVLERFCPSLCEAVCSSMDEDGRDTLDGRSFIKHLTDNNLFVIPLDAHGTWFRFHHLFGQFLREETRRRYPAEEVIEFQQRAAQWLAQNRLVEESLTLFLAAGNVNGAADLVEQNVRSLLDDDRWHILESWIAKLPDPVIRERPALLLAKAWEAFHQFNLSAIPQIVEAATSILKGDQSEQPLWVEVDFFWGHHWYWLGQYNQSLKRLERALDHIPKDHYFARGETELFWGLAMHASNRREEAVQQLERWFFEDPQMHPGRLDKLVGALIFVHLLAGKLPEALAFTRRQKTIAEEHDIRYIQAWINYLFGLIQFQRNDLPGAAGFFAKAARNRYVLHDRAAVDSLVGLAVTRQLLGRYDDARAAVQDLLDLAWESKNASYLTIARSCQARLALLQGDTSAARGWINATDLGASEQNLFFWLEIPHLTESKLLIAESTEASLATATEELANLRQLAEGSNNIGQLIEILVLQVRLYRKQERTKEALDVLGKALSLAAPGGWLRPFVEAGPEITELYLRLSPKGGVGSFLEKIRRMMLLSDDQKRSPGRQADGAYALEETLTFREREVLGLLAAEMSNQEIAAELVISPNTVKRHAGSVYRKLDVGNRRQAVIKAKRLGLLPLA